MVRVLKSANVLLLQTKKVETLSPKIIERVLPMERDNHLP